MLCMFYRVDADGERERERTGKGVYIYIYVCEMTTAKMRIGWLDSTFKIIRYSTHSVISFIKTPS